MNHVLGHKDSPDPKRRPAPRLCLLCQKQPQYVGTWCLPAIQISYALCPRCQRQDGHLARVEVAIVAALHQPAVSEAP